MSRILIISPDWPPAGAPAADRLAVTAAVAATGRETAIITNEPAGPQQAALTNDAALPSVRVIRIPVEAQKASAPFPALRNSLFFDAPANPGNYAMLRDSLHTHLQEVLYDAVLICCPPQVYLRLAYWIHETFGIPLWVHLGAGFGTERDSWNHRRLRRKYLAAAKVITASHEGLLKGIPLHDDQPGLLAVHDGTDAAAFEDLTTKFRYSAETLLQRIIRKKQHA